MGTRNLTLVKKNNEYKIAQYCQWDGYPDGQGRTILEFLKSEFDKEKFTKQLDKIKNISQKEIDSLYKELNINPENDFITMDDSAKFKTHYPQLDRDMGGEILSYVQNCKDNIILLSLDIDFINDSLFCEYAYCLDLDNNELQVFISGNHLLKSYNLDNLPDVENFVNELNILEEAL